MIQANVEAGQKIKGQRAGRTKFNATAVYTHEGDVPTVLHHLQSILPEDGQVHLESMSLDDLTRFEIKDSIKDVAGTATTSGEWIDQMIDKLDIRGLHRSNTPVHANNVVPFERPGRSALTTARESIAREGLAGVGR